MGFPSLLGADVLEGLCDALSAVADKPGDLLRGNDGQINREDRTLAQTVKDAAPSITASTLSGDTYAFDRRLQFVRPQFFSLSYQESVVLPGQEARWRRKLFCAPRPLGNCKLCLQKKDLQNSHLMPRSLYLKSRGPGTMSSPDGPGGRSRP